MRRALGIVAFSVALIASWTPLLRAERLGDLNNDGAIDAVDIDRLAADLRNGSTNLALQDFDGDSTVSNSDLILLVGSLVDIQGGGAAGNHGTHLGDANLDWIVDFYDFRLLKDHLNLSAGWAFGDFDRSGVITEADFDILLQNFGSTGPMPAVPEPATFVLFCIGLTLPIFLARGKTAGERSR